ncbi:ABC transporter ATP-binding protein [Thauera butanivorans]|uniref:ABC transporter ATP-binding protein n=1 Tax=Thauera butanivorans TaxID=86174 RepID=UPI0008383297|nr:ABC transporter ATP-binding protein [Thauera butanivorans]
MSTTNTTPALEVRHLTVSYRNRPVLGDLSLPPLLPGQLVALVGPNATGKSTLLRALARLVPASGQARWDGQDLLAMPAAALARTIGYMPQSLPETAALNVLEVTLTAMQARALPAREEELAAMAVLERLGIDDLAMRRLDQLSGGQRQVAALAQAIARDSPILLLDEPTSALDLRHQWRVMDTVRRLADGGHLVITVLHDLALAAQWADHILVIHRGRLHACGTPQAAITPEMLRTVYGVEARVQHCERGRTMVLIDGPAEAPPA